MRPLKVVISAFNSYAGTVEIDMRRLGTNGLYLISGDTGAGKTTIFDAICYALYGEASGDTTEGRSSDMLRSKYAKENVRTYVELTFEHKGKEYTVTRTAPFKRQSHRKTKDGQIKWINEDATANLSCGNEIISSSTTKVTAKVTEILCLNAKQFHQTTLIAQGAFAKLLTANTDERKKILSRLFNAEKFSEFQERLKSDSVALLATFNDIKAKLKYAVDDIQCCDKCEIFDLWKELKDCDVPEQEEVYKIIASSLDYDNKIIAQCDIDIEKLKTESHEISVNIEKWQSAQNLISKLQKTEKKFKEQKLMYEKAKIEKELAAERRKECDKIQADINRIENSLDKYDRLDNQQNDLKANEKKYSKIEVIIKDNEKKLNNLRSDIQKLEEESIKLEDVLQKAAEIEATLEKLKFQKENFEKLKFASESYDSAIKELEIKQDNYNKLYREFKAKDKKYREAHENFFNATAGILADELKDGAACPVCGSFIHPRPAVKSADVPSWDKLKKFEKDAKTARENSEQASSEAQKAMGEKSAKENILKELAKGTEAENDIDNAFSFASEAIEKLEAQISELIAQSIIQKNNVERRKEIVKLLSVKHEEAEKLSINISEGKANIAALNEIVNALRNEINTISLSLDFSNKNEAQKNIDVLCKMKNDIELLIEVANENYEKYNQEYAKLESEKNTYASQIDSLPEIDFNKECSRKDINEQLYQNVLNAKVAANCRIEKNNENKIKLEKLFSDFKTISKNLMNVENMKKAANGHGRALKIELESYVLQSYFERILQHANNRLLKMTDSQYEFVRFDEKHGVAKTGLDLFICDHFNGGMKGELRSIKSLSGGEKFMAALSLALGLSDSIQNEKGGVVIDTMFIDEGFGSLDQETLEKAIDALCLLAGEEGGKRLVGIISHVEEMRSRIEKQIIVEKENNGFGSKVTVRA